MGDRSIAFFSTPGVQPHNDNHRRLPQAFRAAGWQVTEAQHDDLTLTSDELHINGRTLHTFDWVWNLGFGPRATYQRRVQRLLADEHTRWVVPPQAWQQLHGKRQWLHLCPPTHVADSLDAFIPIVLADTREWIIKPEAGSFGRHVHRVNAQNIRTLAKQLAGAESLWLLQHYLPQIVTGETRTLVAADKIIGSYRRIPKDGLTANLANHAATATAKLSEAERNIVNQVVTELSRARVNFAAIDTLQGYLMEVNLANPGGLATLSELYATDAAAAVVDALRSCVMA